MNSKKIRKLGAWAIAFLVLLYVGYQFYAVQNKGVRTETAMYATVSDTLQAKGFAIRRETTVREAYNGVLNYRVADGERVAQGGAIADVFAGESDAAARNRISQLDREIKNLEALTDSDDHYVSNPSFIGTQIYTSLEMILNEFRNGNYSRISTLKEDLLTSLNRKQLLTGEEKSEDFEARLSLLREERDRLAASAGERIDTIFAPQAGYFVSVTDGMESSVDMERVLSLTPSEVTRLQNMASAGVSAGANAPIGKVCGEFNWYLACVFSEEEMGKFEGVTEVYLDIPFASTEQIPAVIAARNPDPITGETAVIFQCSYMDGGIALLRDEGVQITLRSYSGVLVKTEALHFADVERTLYDDEGNETGTQVEKNVKGVYVEYGGRLKFVQVFTEKTINGHAICKIQLSEEEQAALVTDSTIQLYDEVVTEGTDLYDGKLVR